VTAVLDQLLLLMRSSSIVTAFVSGVVWLIEVHRAEVLQK
jgi:hypothetical protein